MCLDVIGVNLLVWRKDPKVASFVIFFFTPKAAAFVALV